MKKYNLDSDKKAYLQIDFTFAAAIFIIFFAIVSGIFTNYLNSQEDSLTTMVIQEQARELCLFLISTPGEPINWPDSITSSTFVGLKNINTNSLNSSKMNAFNGSNYFDIYDTFNIQEFVYITIEGVSTNTTYMDFGSTTGLTSFSSSYSCYSNYNDEVVRILVEVWR